MCVVFVLSCLFCAAVCFLVWYVFYVLRATARWRVYAGSGVVLSVLWLDVAVVSFWSFHVENFFPVARLHHVCMAMDC